MLWPGTPQGQIPSAINTNASLALAYAINYVFGGPSYGSNDVAFNQDFVNQADTQNANLQGSYVFYGDEIPFIGYGDNSYSDAQNFDTNTLGVSGLTPIAINPPNNDGDDGDGWFPAVPIEPLLIYATPPTSSTSTSMINALDLIVDAQYIDIDGSIQIGNAESTSLSLPAAVDSEIASDQSAYNAAPSGTSPLYTLKTATTISAGDTPITAQYNAQTKQIIVNNVTASGGGFVSLDGGLISTDVLGNLTVADGNGQVTIDNESGYPLVINNVSASTSQTSIPSEVDIIDTFKPLTSQQSLYVYHAGGGILEYSGPATASVLQLQQGIPSGGWSGNTATYNPEVGLRWTWQYQAYLSRTVSQASTAGGNFNGPSFVEATPWVFDPSTESNTVGPWGYLGGQLDTSLEGLPGQVPFDETISGTTQTSSDTIEDIFMYYPAGEDGFTGPTQEFPPGNGFPGIDNGNPVVVWNYLFPEYASVTLTDSVYASNPIGINFTGPALSLVSITSDAPVILAGNITDADGNTTITAPSVTVTATSSSGTPATTPTIISNNLTLKATAGGVGTAGAPVNASVLTNGVLNVTASSSGVYLNLSSGALIGTIQAGTNQAPEDVVLDATGSLTAAPGLPSGTLNVFGNNLTINSSEGSVGTSSTPLQILALGVANVTALSDVNLNQGDPDLQVGQIISKTGNVTLDVPAGQIVNALGTGWAQQLTNTFSMQAWQTLGLLTSSASEQAVTEQTVTAFENEVNADYGSYWDLLDNGSVQNGNLTLNAQGVVTYHGLTALSLGIANPATITAAEVQTYANSQYQNLVTFFNQNLGSNWMTLPDFRNAQPELQLPGDVTTAEQSYKRHGLDSGPIVGRDRLCGT